MATPWELVGRQFVDGGHLVVTITGYDPKDNKLICHKGVGEPFRVSPDAVHEKSEKTVYGQPTLIPKQ